MTAYCTSIPSTSTSTGASPPLSVPLRSRSRPNRRRAPTSTPPPPRRRRTRRPTPPATATALGAVGAFVAGSAAIPGTHANPAPAAAPTQPPSFLCPYLQDRDQDFAHLHPFSSANPDRSPCRSQLLVQARSQPQPQSRPTPRAHPFDKRANLADRYDQSSDGRWYKVQEYTLYGSTICAGSSCSVPTATSTVTTPSMSSTSSASDTLPDGWKSSATTRGLDKSPIILVLAVVAALLIGILIICCVLWRRKRTKEKEKDGLVGKMEMADLSLGDEKKGAMKMQRSWNRASERWRAGIRHAARRRRGKRSRGGMSPSANSSSVDVNEGQEVVTLAVTVTEPSRATTPLSRHTSHDRSRATSPALSVLAPPTSSHSTPASTPSIRRTSSHHSTHSTASYFPADLKAPITHPDLSPSTDERPSSPPAYDIPPPPHSPAIEMEEAPAEPELYFHTPTAHVATDDKALLARMAQSASSPSTSLLTSSHHPHPHPHPHPHSSHLATAPDYPEDEEFEFEDHPSPAGPSSPPPPPPSLPPPPHHHHHHTTPSLFPPPSSAEKGKMPAYDVNYAQFEEDFAMMEPPELGEDEGPSAPPFEASAPAWDEVHASAPDLDLDGGLDMVASAPDLDLDDGVEGQDHDRISGAAARG